MINLLPVVSQEIIKKENARKLVIIGGVLAFVLFLSAIIVLIPSYVFSVSERLFAENELSESKIRLEKISAEAAGKSLAAAEEQAKLVLAGSAGEFAAAAGFIKSIVAARPSRISLTSMSYNPQSIVINGVAEDRVSLVEFARSLERENKFSAVVSPISNLVKGHGQNFSISLTLAK